jgi:hypothetical protein
MRILWIALIVFLAGGEVAKAADTAEVEALIRQGVDLRQQGRDERALPFFQKAYDLAPTPRTAGQLGLAEMATGYWLDAEQHLAMALESPDHPWVAKNKQALEDALKQVRTNIGDLVIEGGPPGATVTVDKKAVGALPLPGPVRVAKGKVNVEVSAPGYATATSSVHVPGAGQQRLVVTLEKVAAATGPGPAPPTPQANPSPRSEPQPPSGQDDGGKLRRQLGWGAAVGAGVLLAAAVVETVVWQGKRSQFNDPAHGCFEDAPMRGASGCSTYFDSAHTFETLAIIGYAVGAALGATSAVLLLTGKPMEASGSRVACAPGLGSSLVSCRLVF